MSNRLPILADQIRRAHGEMEQATKTAAEKALEAGRALIEAKSLVKHGAWLPFLKEAGIHERTARRLMTLAQSNLKSDTVSDLGGPTPALRFLSLRERCLELLRDVQEARDIDDQVSKLATVCELMDDMAKMFPPGEIDAATAVREAEIRSIPFPCIGQVVRLTDVLNNHLFIWPDKSGANFLFALVNLERDPQLRCIKKAMAAAALMGIAQRGGMFNCFTFPMERKTFDGDEATRLVAWLTDVCVKARPVVEGGAA